MSNLELTPEEFESKYVARLSTRKLDWNVLKFQEEIDARYRRAQKRYIGRGATANNDSNVIQAQNFTLSTMVLPAGCIGPLHLHDDVEEVFFVLKGRITFKIKSDDQELEVTLSERDCISCPPGVYRGLSNDGDEEGLTLVLLGASKPNLPTYPAGSKLEEVRIQRSKERESIIKNS